MTEPALISLVGDEPTTAILCACCEQRGYAVKTAHGAAQAMEALPEASPDAMVVVLPLVDSTAAVFLRQLRILDPYVPVVACGRDADVACASDAVSLGAAEYLASPTKDAEGFLALLGVVLGLRHSDAQLRYLRRKDAAGADFQVLGHSVAMRRVLAVVRQICERTMGAGGPTILLTGETGTGKGLLAKTIHYGSARRSRAFVEVNCAAIPPTLLEVELFGHERGAFTDARAARAGLFETAQGGTLFLDEISSLPHDLQAKLLTAIEDRNVRRIGGRRPVHLDLQIIAATHRDLEELVRRGAFREDLYHRLNVLRVEIPPLRERGQDPVVLADAFIAAACREYGLPPRKLSPEARLAIEGYSWPGNVRELKNRVERIVLLENDETIPARAFQFVAARPTVRVARNGGLAVTLPEDGCPLNDLEREVISEAMRRCGGNVSRAARYLSISRQTLIYRLMKHHLRGVVSDHDGGEAVGRP